MVLSEIILFFCAAQTAIFNALDSVYMDSYSWLDIMVAIMFMTVVINFIIQMRGGNMTGREKTQKIQGYHRR